MALLVRGLDSVPLEACGGAIAIGNFDGIHLGHRQLVRLLIDQSRRVGGPSVILTFDPPPIKLLRPDMVPPALTWMERRAEILFKLGIDYVIIIETTHKLLDLSAEDFYKEILVDLLNAKSIIEGPNFHFGKDRRGDIELLDELCQQHGVHLTIADGQSSAGHWVSSSRVRSLIDSGDIREANKLLLEPYRLHGRVVQGAARGRTIGFPTANLGEIDVLVPPHGVYAGAVTLGQVQYPAAIHIGPNPTFAENATKVEVFLLDFSGDLYGAMLEVELLEQIRGVKKFDGVEQLVAQLNVDIEKVRQIYQAYFA
jgi:riboflavin kinase / FMN adenylyltransferase